MGECHGAAFSLLDPARSAGYDERNRSLVGLFGAGAGLGQITESRIVADYILENGDYSPTLLDILDAVQRSESMDAEQRVQYESSGEVLPLAEFRRQAAAARTAEENLSRAQEKLDSRLAELDAEQQRLQADEAQKREDWQAVPTDAASVKRKRAAFEAWKDAHGKYEKFVNNRAADETSARTDYEASTRQNQDALRVANDRMNGHYVRLASLFRDDVAAMERARDVQLTRTDARRRYDAAAQRIDGLMDTGTERTDGLMDTETERPAQYTIQQGGQNDGRAEGSEIHSERPRDLVGGRETAQAQADGSGDTGSSGSGSPRGGVLPQTGVDRRGLRRDGIHVLAESRERLTQAGVTDFGLSVTEDHQAFSDALNRMRAENPNGASVDAQSVDDLVGATTISNPEWTAGGAVQPSGNIVAVFKNSNADSRKNAGLDILFHAIALGGDRLDCYGIFLVNTYAKGGMVPVARVAYARGINPEMDAHIDSMRRAGNLNFATDPDIYFMKLRAGARYEDLVDDYVNGRYHQYTPEELDALPLMSYDEAEAYRDSLLEQERRQGDYAGAVQELGEAAQQEDAADAEGVDRAAVDAKMRAARAGGAEAAQEAAGAAAGKGQGKDASTAQTAATEAQRPSWTDVDAGAQARAVSLGERLGVPVVFEQMPEGFTGRYEDGVIHIATRLPAGEAPELTVLRHELTHYLEGSAEYGALSDYVVQLAQRLNPQLNVNRVLEGLAEEYATRGVELSPDGARREFVARFVQDKLLRDETAIDRLVRERSGVAGRVLNWIEYRIARLKLRGQNSAEARALLEAERLYAKAFARAGTRPELTDDGAQYSIEYDRYNTPYVVIEEDILANVPPDKWVSTVKDNLRQKFPNGVAAGNNVIRINATSRGKLTYSKYLKWLLNNEPQIRADKLRATNNADELIRAAQNWVNEDLKHPRNDSITDFARGEVRMRIGRNEYAAEVVVGNQGPYGLLLYDVVDLVPISILKKTKASAEKCGTPHRNEFLSGSSAPAETNIPKSGEDVKEKLYSEPSYSLDGLTWDEMVARYGAKPAGAEPRTRDEAVPERAGDEQRVSDFLRSFVESDKATDEMVAQVRAAVENGDNRKPYANILTEKYREKRRVQSLHQTAWMCSSINWI